jgi:uncharacterized protein (DUF4415 family)
MRPEMRPKIRPDDLRPPMRPDLRPPLTDEDGEVRELTAEDFKDMRPLSEVDPGLIEAVAEYRRKRGRPKSPAPKIYIGFRLAPDVVESVRASGPGYNARVEEALRKAGFGAAAEKPVAKKTLAKAALTREETDVLNALAAADRIDPHVEEAMRKAGVGTAKTKPAKKPTANKTPGRVYIEARPKGRQGSAIEGYVVEQGDRVLKTFKTQAEAISWAKSVGHSPHVARDQVAKPALAKKHA